MNDMMARGRDEHSSDQDDGESNDDQDSQLNQERSQDSNMDLELVIDNTVDGDDWSQVDLILQRVQVETLSVSLNEHSTYLQISYKDLQHQG